MNPLDGPIRPGEEPEPSEKEFRADFERVREVFEAMPERDEEADEEERDPDATLRVAELLEGFVARHKKRLRRMNMPTDEFLQEAARLRAQLVKKQAKLQEAIEAELQARANLAQMQPEATELIFQIVADIRANWETMDYAAREKWGEILQEYEENREQWLAELPVEDRRRLEEKFPQ